MEFVLIVILAILLPPLGVYLYENSITINFWITLILCLASMSFFVSRFLGGLWVIAVIWALLVVFGVL